MSMSLVRVFSSFDLIMFASQSFSHLETAFHTWVAEVRPYLKRVQQSVLTDGTVILAVFYEKQRPEDPPTNSFMKGDHDAYEA